LVKANLQWKQDLLCDKFDNILVHSTDLSHGIINIKVLLKSIINRSDNKSNEFCEVDLVYQLHVPWLNH